MGTEKEILSILGKILSGELSPEPDKFGLPVDEKGNVLIENEDELLSRILNIPGKRFFAFSDPDHRSKDDDKWLTKKTNIFAANRINNAFFEGFDTDYTSEKFLNEYNQGKLEHPPFGPKLSPTEQLLLNLIKDKIEFIGTDNRFNGDNGNRGFDWVNKAISLVNKLDLVRYFIYLRDNSLCNDGYIDPETIEEMTESNQPIEEFKSYFIQSDIKELFFGNYDEKEIENNPELSDYYKKLQQRMEKKFAKLNNNLWEELDNLTNAKTDINKESLQKLAQDIDLIKSFILEEINSLAKALDNKMKLSNEYSAKIITDNTQDKEKAFILWGEGHFNQKKDMDEYIDRYSKTGKNEVLVVVRIANKEELEKYLQELKNKEVKDNPDYLFLTYEGKAISVEKYLEYEQQQKKLEKAKSKGRE